MAGSSLSFALAILAGSRLAAAAEPADVERAREILSHAVSVPTVAGRGQVPALARWIAEKLREAGFASNEVEIIPVGETAALLARYPGRDTKLPALILSVHMDVVGAQREDWKRDPFVLSELDGFLYGRGTIDDKLDMSLLIATLSAMRQQGFRPERDIVLAITGDEEIAGPTARMLADRLRGAWLVINGDLGPNSVRADGTPEPAALQTAEKTYINYEFRTANPGGHSSMPPEDNAIHQLAAALTRLAAYRFPAELNDTTRAYMAAYADQAPDNERDALLAVARNFDAAAVEQLSRDAWYNALLRTTCVPTKLNAGIAENALPEHASATVNCRIMPGTAVDAVTKQLRTVVADPKVQIVQVTDDTGSPVSPLRRDVIDALQKAWGERYPGMRVLPLMSPGGTDCRHFRVVGIDCYAIGSVFMHADDMMMHGPNERVPVTEIAPALDFWDALIRQLTSGSPKRW